MLGSRRESDVAAVMEWVLCQPAGGYRPGARTTHGVGGPFQLMMYSIFGNPLKQGLL